MKLLVIGSESFVGKELINQCKKKEVEVIGVDIIEKENSDFEYHRINITSPEIVKTIPDNIDAIIHLAALSRDKDCVGRAYECFENNVMGTLNLIKYSLQKNVKQFIFASSEWVYDKFDENESKDENYLINYKNLTSEYALSKFTSEINLWQHYLQTSCNITILRFGIIYGPRKSNWSAVEAIASQVKNNEIVEVNSLQNGRRFIHVSDIAKGILSAIGIKGFEIFNLTGNKIITIGDLIKESERLYDKKIRVIEKNPNEKNIRNPSNEKAKKILNWSPEINLYEGLKTIDKFL